jgi:hypothetical protein
MGRLLSGLSGLAAATIAALAEKDRALPAKDRQKQQVARNRHKSERLR